MQWPLHDQFAIAHALFACIAALFTLPVALIATRFMRKDPRWFRTHVIFNTLTTLLIILTFGLGIGAVQASDLGMQFAGPNSDLHHQVGAAVLSTTLMQFILGVLAHYTPRGSFFRRLHVPFGIIVAAGIYWNTWEGMHNEWAEMSTSMTVTPEAVQIVFWALFFISALIYAVLVGEDVLSTFSPEESRQLESSASIPRKYEGPVASDKVYTV